MWLVFIVLALGSFVACWIFHSLAKQTNLDGLAEESYDSKSYWLFVLAFVFLFLGYATYPHH